VNPEWQVALGLVYKGTLYYEALPTAVRPVPLPARNAFRCALGHEERRYTAVAAAPGRVYGPYVLNLRIGDYVPGLDPKWQRIRFIDAGQYGHRFRRHGHVQDEPERHQ
jgi:hypothetical protein